MSPKIAPNMAVSSLTYVMPLLKISFDLFFPLCADGRA